MTRFFFIILLILSSLLAGAQPLQLLDRFNGNKVVNDSTVTVWSSDLNTLELTQYFTMVNNTDKPLALFLRKKVNVIGDSTTDYFCFGVKCWPGTDTTDIADTIQPGASDYTFASHVVHVRRFDIPQPPLPPGLSSITYTIYDNRTFPEPVEASVTVIYHLSGLGMDEPEEGRMTWQVFPNPATERITVRNAMLPPGKYEITVFNVLGREMKRSWIHQVDDGFILPVAELSPGTYLARVSGAENPGTFLFQVSK